MVSPHQLLAPSLLIKDKLLLFTVAEISVFVKSHLCSNPGTADPSRVRERKVGS